MSASTQEISEYVAVGCKILFYECYVILLIAGYTRNNKKINLVLVNFIIIYCVLTTGL